MSDRAYAAPTDRVLRERIARTLAGLSAAEDRLGTAQWAALGQLAKSERRRIVRERGPGLGRRIARKLTALADALVRHALRICIELARAETRQPAGEVRLALVATGGYGRGELLPRSDIDIAVVSGGSGALHDAVIKRLYHAIFGIFQEGLGLEVGYAFREPSAVAEVDDRVLTSLLDARLVAGDQGVFEALCTAVGDRLDPVAFVLSRVEERKALHLDHEPAMYRLEPNLKNSAGGARDYQLAMWAARVAFGLPQNADLEALRERGIVEEATFQEVLLAREHLLDMRAALQLACGRNEAVLYQSRQPAVAERLGYEPQGELLPAEVMMRDHFRHASARHRFAERLSRRAARARFQLPHGFAVERGQLVHDDQERILAQPDLAVAAFGFVNRYGIALSGSLEDCICRSASRPEPLQMTPLVSQTVLDILLGEGHTAQALRKMRDTGILSKVLPQFGDIVGRIPQDPAHAYTICEHSLQVVELLTELCQQPSDGLEGLARVYNGLPPASRRALLFAALLHDVGKAVDGARHADIGGDMALEIGRSIGLPAEETAMACRLIKDHLLMARTSRLRDISVETTLRDFAQAVGDAGSLDRLYLLTYADTKAVGLATYSDVEGRALDDLYTSALPYVMEGAPERDVSEAAERVRARVVRELRLRDISSGRVAEHLEQMPAQYVLRTPVPVIAMHIYMVRDLERTGRPVVRFFNEPGRNFTETDICAYDDPQPGLFSKICGTIYANGIDIHSASIRTRSSTPPIAVDTLLIDYEGGQVPETLSQTLRRDLENVLTGGLQVSDVMARRRRPPPVRAQVIDLRLDNGMSDEHTVIELRARDSLGLLYQLTDAIAQCGLNLHSAHITTWAGEAEDTFYVTQDGRPIPDHELSRIQDKLWHALSPVRVVAMEPGGRRH